MPKIRRGIQNNTGWKKLRLQNPHQQTKIISLMVQKLGKKHDRFYMICGLYVLLFLCVAVIQLAIVYSIIAQIWR